MAEDEQTLGAAVQMIMETMSDSVSQLVLLVVSLQEQNAALPPGLPPAATGVAGAANTLIEVVRALAEEEYNDFPDIKESILKAADDTDVASTGLVNAVEVIKTATDRKVGWSGLLEACRVISGNTIRVLQIVYGAQLRRLLCVANMAQDLLNDVDINLLRIDPQGFADKMGEVVGKIADLGAYTTQKSQDEESPVTKAEYATKGAELATQSDELLAATNELLQNSDDKALENKFLEIMEQAKANVQSLMPTINEQVAQLPENQEQTQAEESGAEHQIPPLSDSIQRAERALGRLVNAIIHSDNAEIAESLKLLSASVSDIADYCTHTRNAQAQGYLAEIQAILPELIMHARAAMEREISDETRAEIAADTERIRNCLDALSSTLAEPGDHITGVVERQLVTLDSLAESASIQDAQNVVSSLKQLAATQNKLVPLINQYATENTDSKSDLDKSLAELEALLPQNVTAAKGFLQDTANPQSQHRLYEVIDVMRAPLFAVQAAVNHSAYKQVGAFESRQHANAVLLHNASTTPNTITAAKAIGTTAKAFSQQAKLIADTTTDTQVRVRLESNMNALNTLLEAQALAQAELEKDPKNEEARKRLNNASEAILARNAALASELHDVSVIQDILRQAVESKNSKDVEAALNELDKSINDTVSLARAAVSVEDNDNVEWLRSSLASLDEAVSEQRNAARVAVTTGDTAELVVAMEAVANQLATIRSRSAKSVAGKTSDERLVDKASTTCIMAIDQLERSTLEGDSNSAAAAARALVDALALTTQHANESVKGKDQPSKERTEDAIARADAKVAALLLATRESLNDGGSTVSLALAADEARRAVIELSHAVVLPPEELLVSAQQTHRNRTKALRDAVERNKDGKASDAEVAKALHATVESGKQVLDALNALEKDGSHSHAGAKVEKHLAGLIAAEKATKEGGARAQKAPAAAVHLAEQISVDSEEATRGMAPQVVSEAKHMENALDRLANMLSDSSTPPDPANIHSVQLRLFFSVTLPTD